MSPTRLREVLAHLHWSQRELARVLGRGEGNVRQMARGVVAIPSDVATWLEALVQFHQANPPPRRNEQ